MNKNGFAVKEMILLSGLLAIFFGFAITKVSYAYQEASNSDSLMEQQKNSLIIASEEYAKYYPDKFKEKETYIYGEELIEAGFLRDIEEFDYENVKIKITKISDTEILAQLVDSYGNN